MSVTIEFGKNLSGFLLLQDLYSTDNSYNVLLKNEKGSTGTECWNGVSNSISEHNIYQEVSQSDSFSNAGHNSVLQDPIFDKLQNIPSNLN